MKTLSGTLLLAAASAVLPAQQPGSIALHGARVFTVSGPVLNKGTVLLRDGLIEAVGEDIDLPKDAWVIDATGLSVYPGLIDSLSTVGLPETPQQTPPPRASAEPPFGRQETPMPLEQGPELRPFTTSWVRAADVVNPGDHRIAETRSAGFTSVAAFPSAGIFAGEGALLNLSGEKAGRMIVASPTGQYLTLATRGFGTYPGSLMGVLAYIRQLSLDADYYRLAIQNYDKHPSGHKRPVYDRASEGLLESPRLLFPADTPVQVDRMLRFAAGLTRPAVLYGGHGAYRVADHVARASIPMLVSLKWPERPKDPDPDEEETFRALEMRDRAPSAPAELRRQGALFAFYSGGVAPKDIRKAVRRAIGAGLSEADAVRAFTLSAAQIYGLADRLGSIEAGKIANLVITKGGLFDEKSTVEYVLIDGVKYSPVPGTKTGDGQGRATSGGIR
ncbi:MAG: amidohydrolase family protein [Bryobacteraceae bacterium]